MIIPSVYEIDAWSCTEFKHQKINKCTFNKKNIQNDTAYALTKVHDAATYKVKGCKQLVFPLLMQNHSFTFYLGIL